MMPKATPSSLFPNDSQGIQHMFPVTEYLVLPSVEVISTSSSASHGTDSSLLLYLSILKDKFSELQNMVSSILISPEQNLPAESTSIAISNMNSTIQELIVAASSMRFACQQMALASNSRTTTITELNQQLQFDHNRLPHHQPNHGNNNINNIGSDVTIREQSLFSSTEAEAWDWFAETYTTTTTNNNNVEARGSGRLSSVAETDIIELDATDLLARYTHFCHVCGKGFKRDANLRMHMRAHGDEYKTNEALSSPMKHKGINLGVKPKKYSCPQEGCRWNQKHEKFQPLKSMVCVKNHYKRSHCPKMYICRRCNQKQFSVLSDLRAHEKHCGDPKWLCSCGTTFSRKDKLMGHVALFVGHTPVTSSTLSCSAKSEQQALFGSSR